MSTTEGRAQAKDRQASNDAQMAPACDQCRQRKVRCDRQLPECSSCRKSGYGCRVSNRWRRVNLTKQLVQDFSGLDSRLASIDDSIIKVFQLMAPKSSPHSVAERPDDPEDSDLLYARIMNQPVPIRDSPLRDCPPTMRQVVDHEGCERFYGYTAALSLFRECQQSFSDLIDTTCLSAPENSISPDACSLPALLANDPSPRFNLRGRVPDSSFQGVSTTPSLGVSSNIVACPPRAFLDSSLKIFLEYVNSVVPIFDEECLRKSIEEYYSEDNNESSNARNLCFNNIIILALNVKMCPGSTGFSKVNGKGMDDDLLLSFLNNSSRAIQNLDAFSAPSTINIQALVTLTLVSLEFCEEDVASTICQRACHLAKAMALHQTVPGADHSSKQSNERHKLFWTLYIMDKQKAFTSGHPCELYLFDSSIELPQIEAGSTERLLKMGQIHLMVIWEEIYLALYSSKAMRRSLLNQRQQRLRLSNLLKKWSQQHSQILLKVLFDLEPVSLCMHLELRYCFYVAQVLVHRHSNKEADVRQCESSARVALSIIVDAYQDNTSISSAILLRRLFRNYPMVAFVDLHIGYFKDPEHKDPAIVDLLTNVVKALAAILCHAFPRAYYSYIHIGMTWCIDTVSLVRSAIRRTQKSRSPSDNEQMPSHVHSEFASDAVSNAVSTTTDTFHISPPGNFENNSTVPSVDIPQENGIYLNSHPLDSIWESQRKFRSPMDVSDLAKANVNDQQHADSTYSARISLNQDFMDSSFRYDNNQYAETQALLNEDMMVFNNTGQEKMYNHHNTHSVSTQSSSSLPFFTPPNNDQMVRGIGDDDVWDMDFVNTYSVPGQF